MRKSEGEGTEDLIRANASVTFVNQDDACKRLMVVSEKTSYSGGNKPGVALIKDEAKAFNSFRRNKKIIQAIFADYFDGRLSASLDTAREGNN